LILVALVFLHLVALHHVGSNNPDGIDIFKHVDENGKPLDGVAFHPYFTVKDIVAVCGFLVIYMGVVFFAPDMGGVLLEKDNFAPANPLQTPPDIVPLWYFTPYYSILRASTTSLLTFLAWSSLVIAIAGALLSKADMKLKAIFLVAGAVGWLVFMNSSGKAMGVVLMGGALVCFFLLPWLDRSPVLSVRYRSLPFKVALAIFLVAFFILGYLGMNAPTPGRTLVAQICTCVYFGFFILMPWFTSIGKTKPVPERIIVEEH
jgi:ubiquinol-cytochrome c reductase cytochrome b subunit